MFSSFNHKMRLLAIATIAFSLPGFSAFANDDITFEVPPTDPPENVGNNHGHWRMPPHPISACYSDGVLSSAEWPYVDEALHIDWMPAAPPRPGMTVPESTCSPASPSATTTRL